MEARPVHSESELQSTLTEQHGPIHYRKDFGATNDGTASHGPLTGLTKKASPGSQEFKEHNVHSDGHTRAGSHGLMGFLKRDGSHEVKHGDGDHHGQHHHNHHGSRDKEVFGSEDADVNYREHADLFGSRDMENPKNVEKANSLFGYEDTEFERGQKGRDLFGNDDPDTLSSREKMNVMGPVEADERTRHVFGDENAEDSDESGDEPNRVKKVHQHGHHAHN